jgi:hypothetical protein
MPMRSPYAIRLTKGERAELLARSKEYTSPYRDVVRARIVLLGKRPVSPVIQAALRWSRRVRTPAKFHGSSSCTCLTG